MVANAHQDQGPEGKKIFDAGYLIGVIGVITVITVIPILKFSLQETGIPFYQLCLGNESKEPKVLTLILIVFLVLGFIFTVLAGLRTSKNLKKLQDCHLKNLPTNNALTYLDTQILCLLIFVYVVAKLIPNMLFTFDILSWKVSFFVMNMINFFIMDIVICVGFPIYITLKTRTYLPTLWDDDAPLILQNNDFYAERLSQVSPQSEIAESRL